MGDVVLVRGGTLVRLSRELLLHMHHTLMSGGPLDGYWLLIVAYRCCTGQWERCSRDRCYRVEQQLLIHRHSAELADLMEAQIAFRLFVVVVIVEQLAVLANARFDVLVGIRYCRCSYFVRVKDTYWPVLAFAKKLVTNGTARNRLCGNHGRRGSRGACQWRRIVPSSE